MSADLSLIALRTTEQVRALHLINNIHVLVDDEDVGLYADTDLTVVTHSQYDAAHQTLYGTPDRDDYGSNTVWVGSYSSLKAGLLEDEDRYLPERIIFLYELLVEPKIITPALRGTITLAFNMPDRSIYGRHRRPDGFRWRQPKAQHVKKFLERNMGAHVGVIGE